MIDRGRYNVMGAQIDAVDHDPASKRIAVAAAKLGPSRGERDLPAARLARPALKRRKPD
jgi:hypothetical protein